MGKLAPRSCPFHEEGHHRQEKQVGLRTWKRVHCPSLQCECGPEAEQEPQEGQMAGRDGLDPSRYRLTTLVR